MYIFEINPLPVASFAIIFSQSEGCLFTLLIVSFALGKPRGSGWRGRGEGGSGWGTHVNPWLFHSNV